MVSYHLLYVTMADETRARTLARRLVEEKLAACVHLLPAGQSFYEWQGALCERAELVLLIKTRAELSRIAIETIVDWHDDVCPCVLSLPIADGHPPFLAWVKEQTREA